MLLSHYIGTDEVVAYCMVYLMVGVTSSFMGSWVDAISSLGSMAYGAKNYDLLAQYLKVSCLAYTVCEIPCTIIWYCIMDKVLLLMQFNDTIAALEGVCLGGHVYQHCILLECWYLEFLEVIGHATYSSAMYIIFCFIEAGLIIPFALLIDRISLVEFGLVMLLHHHYYLH